MMLKAITITALLVLTISCQRESEWVSLGPDAKASLVVVFKKGTTQRAITEFLDAYIFVKTSPSGFWPRPGIGPVVVASVQGHDGYAVTFSPKATLEQRRSITRDVRSAPIVFEVFEEIAPIDIVLDAKVVEANESTSARH